MLPAHFYINRKTGQKETEKVYGARAIALIYGAPRWIAPLLRWLASRPLISRLYGWLQSRPRSAKKVDPFVKTFELDPSEFEKREFSSFNDFFVRKIRRECRPVAETPAVIPADGRYWVTADLDADFYVKGERFSCERFLGEGGAYAAVLGRLCPTDGHRFHFPCDGVPGESRLINGPLFSVNPFILHRRLRVLWENRRFVTPFTSDAFGPMWIVEVGATHVGSVVQTYKPGERVTQGQEKGYFQFGGSAIVLLFPKGSIQLAADLVENSGHFIETKCLSGEPLGAIFS